MPNKVELADGLRQAIYTTKYYDLMQEFRFTKVSEGSKAATIMAEIMQEIVKNALNFMEEQKDEI